MRAQHDVLPTVPLTEDDIQHMPSTIRRKITSAVSDHGSRVEWFILGTSTVSGYKLLQRIGATLLQASVQTQKKITDARISELMEFYLEGEVRAEVDIELERDNAALRADYIKNTRSYTAMEIRSIQTGTAPKNPSDPAARWKREKRIFAISHGNNDLFPAFQFVDGAPHKGIKKILRALPEDMSPWQIAFWFESANGWLDGEAPKDCLNNIDDLLDAADRLNQPAVG